MLTALVWSHQTLTGRSARRHRTLSWASGVLSVLDLARVEHRTHCTGCRVFPLHASGVACLKQRVSDWCTGRSECVRWCASGVRASCNPLCAWVRWASDCSESGEVAVCRTLCVRDRWVLDVSGAHLVSSGGPQMTVRDWRARFKGHVANPRALDAGGRASDVPCWASGVHDYSPMKVANGYFFEGAYK